MVDVLQRVVMREPTSLGEFRNHARALIGHGVKPPDVTWMTDGEIDLFGGSSSPLPAIASSFSVPSGYVDLARDVLCHRDAARFAKLYELLWRIVHGERTLMEIISDPLVHNLKQMQKAVRRDLHKMTAFVRFREVEGENGEHYVAWFEPGHLILRPAADFFVKRFAAMRWSILTPDGSLHWDLEKVAFGPAVPRSQAPTEDTLEEWWKSYYRSTFNPARANPKMMRTEMPVRYWKNLPEASLIPDMLAQAEGRARDMVAKLPTTPRKAVAPFSLPAEPKGDALSLPDLKAQAVACTRCPLYAHATQTVFGEGPPDAPVVFVGEQPGDQEDLVGRPFVGPAGQMFDRAMAEAGLDRSRAYVTNAVKHFKFEPRGKRRIHSKPNAGEIEACRWWVEREVALIQPQLIVALGATAARSLTGQEVKITRLRGTVTTLQNGLPVFFTVHPSYLLRLPDAAIQTQEYRRFVADLVAIGTRSPALLRAA